MSSRASAYGLWLVGVTVGGVAHAADVGGHVGIAVPLLTLAEESTFVGADFVTVGLTPGITVNVTKKWAVDFEFIALNRWSEENGVTTFVVDPGVVRKFKGGAAGLRVATEVGAPTNLGLVPIGVVPFEINPKLSWFLELDLPVFVRDTGDGFSPSVSALFQTGFGF